MALKIITASERLKEKRGAKLLITGVPGIGKTSLLKTLPLEQTLFLDIESGDLAVRGLEVDQLKAETWKECRELACMVGGPNPNLPEDEPYSQAHYDAMVAKYGELDLTKYNYYFIDSLSVASRWSFQWAQQQPEAFNKAGERDTRSAYGIHGQQMAAFVSQVQRARDKNVIFVCIIDEKQDDFKRNYWSFQMDGQKAGEVIPGVVDEIATLAMISADDGDFRALVTDINNDWGYPAKDRSGNLDPLEKPDLTNLISKITGESPTAEPVPKGRGKAKK